ncbi:MAG: DoxX family membrane protein [Chloroflexi bacterium]|nr:DoxX family membrane protein [Chloroflexota bacterium]
MSIKKFISAPLTLAVLRIVLGVIFVFASYSKIMNPIHFKAVVAEYQILPDSIVPLVAIILPWVEFLCGSMLILNIYTQSNALIVLVVLCAFTFGIVNNFMRGLIHDCGCFEFLGGWFGIKEDISFVQIIRDLIFILLVLPILFYGSNVFLWKKLLINALKDQWKEDLT